MEVKFDYTNWRGVRSTKRVIPKALTFFDVPANVNPALASYPPGFFLEAFDLDKQDTRHYYLGGDPERRFNPLPGEGFPIPFGDLGMIQAALHGFEKHVIEIEAVGEVAHLKATPAGTPPEIERLATYMLDHYPNYPFEGSAVDFAIQVLEGKDGAGQPVGKETSPALSSLAAKYLRYDTTELIHDLYLQPEHMSIEAAGRLVTAIRALAGSVLSQDETPD